MEKARKIFWQIVKNNSLDLRSLALFRISVASILLLDLILRFEDIQSFYTDSGVLPRDFFQNIIRIYPHFLSGSFDFQFFLFLTQIVFAVFLLIGYKTKISTIISWFLLVSLINRNPYVIHTGDLLLRTALFWGIFLPLGKFSLDSVLNPNQSRKTYNIFSYATIAITLQTMASYFFPGVFKLTTPQWISGDAIYYSLSSDQWATSFGQMLLHFPSILTLLTYATMVFEVTAPFIFIFSTSKKIKMLIIFCFILLQVGFLFNLTIGTFPLMSVAVLTALLPSFFWENLRRLLSERGTSLRDIVPKEEYLSPFSKLLVIFALILVILSSIGMFFYIRPPRNKQVIGSFFNQNIKMFAPPPFVDVWIVIPGQLANGREVDIYRNGAKISFEKPKISSGFTRQGFYPNQRWVSFLGKIGNSNPEVLPYYARHLCNKWNSTHFEDDHLNRIKIIYMMDRTILYQPDVREQITKLNYECT